MKTTAFRIAAAAFAAGAACALAQADKAPAPAPAPERAAPIKYDPPKRGAPKGRVGGGTRGLEARELTLAVLAPDHAGLSSVAAPKLYWFLSRPIASGFEVSVIEDGAADAVLDRAIPAPANAGIQVIDLDALGVRLKPDREYRWFVSAVANPNARSGDFVASGKVIWQPLPAELAASLGAANDDTRIARYAQAGYWYDAYARLRAARERHPDSAPLRDAEIDLLGQVGLPDVVRHLAPVPGSPIR